ncbi:MAG: metallophosphoesterase, partial [Kofleriaceae bacterium]
MRLAGVILALAAAAGCDRGHPREPPRQAPAPPPPAASAPAPSAMGAACTLTPVAHQVTMPKRLVAIGDLHGDLSATRAALRTAGAIDKDDRWIGGALVVVQTGDVLDRGDDEQAILDLVTRLEVDAKAAGGALIMLLGNHELMNGAGDFRYVTPGGLADFDDVPNLDTDKFAAVPERARKRIAALAPGGPYAKRLAMHNVIAIVGDTVFSHAGVIGEWVTQVAAVNQSARCWLDGQSTGPEQPPPAMTSQDSPVWTRAVGLDSADCAAVKASLAALGVKRMVVGHTVQSTINAICGDAVGRIDVGLGKNYGGPIEVL